MPRGGFTDTFEKAAWEGQGRAVQPVRSEYGNHVIQVTERGLALRGGPQDDIAALSVPSRSSPWHLAAGEPGQAAITVDPRFGVWDATGRGAAPGHDTR